MPDDRLGPRPEALTPVEVRAHPAASAARRSTDHDLRRFGQKERPAGRCRHRKERPQSGLMMAGALGSRLSGFVRSAAIVAALGTGLPGDVYTVANTLPNIVFMLLMGGALNSVLVPELVRAVGDEDNGQAFTDRLVTVCFVLVLVLTAGAVLAAPGLVSLYAPNFTGVQREATVILARLCLPQIFFYGIFGILGQVLVARGRPAATMWAPVANNVVVIGVFGMVAATVGQMGDIGQVTEAQWVWLGAGSTLGIVVQAVLLLPSLYRSGYRWRPRFDWLHSGLMNPLRAAGWAFLVILVSQVAFWVITVLATTVSERAAADGQTAGVGLTAYNNAYQLWVVPQGIIVVSLVTAALPSLSRAAQTGSYADVSEGIARTVRATMGLIVPASLVFLLLGEEIAMLAYGYGTVDHGDVEVLGDVLAAFALGLPAFCVQYTATRGFYVLDDAKTPVLLALITAGTNAALSAVAAQLLPIRWAVTGMAAAHTCACIIGATATILLLRRHLRRASRAQYRGHTETSAAGRSLGLVGMHLRVAIACLPGLVATHYLTSLIRSHVDGGRLGDAVSLLAGCTLLGASLLALSRPLRVAEALQPILLRLRRN
ncbi:murein biosynthesis integral membrane protein MurJ [Streptomyces sp. NPDC087908]|uniref:murein biosynthesis integral membrane protein MurJ n=1 Tax=Streptomyces sp. NPDC087908 TaxID=3365820 RepID=UPI0037F8E10A